MRIQKNGKLMKSEKKMRKEFTQVIVPSWAERSSSSTSKDPQISSSMPSSSLNSYHHPSHPGSPLPTDQVPHHSSSPHLHHTEKTSASFHVSWANQASRHRRKSTL
ncbi:hypothetical protein SDJN02_23010, partial [Cucurbita argyrosperma subsp. argyrosperma]